ncbi:hypothetical protein chiPu_0031506 [Chiloscyllium punctatum]|uniref:Uncharacterized protein n=1 Tax=Chiloscyllium punctatum TaxID=137246 RepID=A0A401TXI5_CHIPU|nr:hypothetical protein [Chiloscyllium punctatum]
MDLEQEPKVKVAAAAAPAEPPKAGEAAEGEVSPPDSTAEQPGPSGAEPAAVKEEGEGTEAEVGGQAQAQAQAQADKKPAAPREGGAEEEEDDEEGDAVHQAKKLRVEPARDKKDKKQKVDEDEIQKMQ